MQERASAPPGLQSWLGRLVPDAPSSSNQPSLDLPFQRWFKFKEAFAPSLVVDCLKRLPELPASCLDVFGGCGTTALTCQFLGIRPTLIEVNPFIADLAESKLQTYDLNRLQEDYLRVRRTVRAMRTPDPAKYFCGAPATLYQPGEDGRWIFPRPVLEQILKYRLCVEELGRSKNARLLRVLLGSILIACSNVVVNGKGRRYRETWQSRQRTPDVVDVLYEEAFLRAISDLQAFAARPERDYTLLRGSCLDQIADAPKCAAAIFSPPYPNSFDYTDIYNVELWTLGYLKSKGDNVRLRTATLRSHVQLRFAERGRNVLTPTLTRFLAKLDERRSSLWNRRLPEMVRGYFSDLDVVLTALRRKLQRGASTFIIVGDSRYAGVPLPVADILAEIARQQGYRSVEVEQVRQMRVSPQQGGQHHLGEHILRLTY